MPFQTPILLITFNRPNHTQQVFDEIKKQKPVKLFVFQDGLRVGNILDIEKCKAVRTIFETQLDWDCELHTNFSSVNLGCGKGPSTGISWFFEHVEQGLIFEDDAVPNSDFFQYAEELLKRYKENVDIRAISSMKVDQKIYGDASYYFTMLNRNLCAWATWKRAWKDFDYYMEKTTGTDLKKALKKYRVTIRENDYWRERLDEIHTNRLNESSWDMQFVLSIWLNYGKGIAPNVNLSTNIGFDVEGTHTTSSDNPAANLQTYSILPLVHPDDLKMNRKSDLNYHKLYFQPLDYGISGIKRMPFRLNKKIKRYFGHEGSWIRKNNAIM